MDTTLQRIARFIVVTALAAATAGVAAADDTEIFTGGVALAESGLVKPNVLFIIDTSGSMDDIGQAALPYDANTTYPGSCAADRVYFTRGTTDPSDPANVPDCSGLDSTMGWFPKSWFKCNAATTAMTDNGYYIVSPSTTAAAQWRNTAASGGSAIRKWRDIQTGDALNFGTGDRIRYVECKADSGNHGDGVDAAKLWPKDDTSTSGTGLRGPWSNSSSGAMNYTTNNSGVQYILWSANYLNYYRDPGSAEKTKLQVVQEAAKTLITQLAAANEVNVGLMRYSVNQSGSGCANTRAEGGMVLVAMDDVVTNQSAMNTAIDGLTANGCTPLSETLWEAYRYMSGGAVDYGLASKSTPTTTTPSVLSSRQSAPNTGIYKSPMLESCQNSFIVFLTDGLPTADTGAETKIETLIGAQCDDNPDNPFAANGRCLDDLAGYIRNTDLRSTLSGAQSITTFFIGFGSEIVDVGSQLMEEAGTAGGGGYYTAESSIDLVNAFNAILLETITREPTSFTAPAVSINAFNRTQNLNDLYVSIFKPDNQLIWPGNLKKYRLDPETGEVVDASSPTPLPAVDADNGFFKDTATSYWSDEVDGSDVEKGGAANEQPAPSSRKLYSDVNTATIPGLATESAGPDNTTLQTNRVADGNALITNVMLGLAAGDSAAERTQVISWLLGADVDGADPTAARKDMGDPLHGRPATVIYGGSVANPDANDGLIFSVTNSGYLHAINITDGAERWAFMPKELLTQANTLFSNTEATLSKAYGLDGDVKVFRKDVDGNGVIEPTDGDKVYLFFGMGRGGSSYYGLDVTSRDAPVLLWKVGPGETGTKQLPGAGQSWSTPSLARIKVDDGSSQNDMQLVLVFGGGYDTAQDTANGAWLANDSVGNQIFIIDAVSGTRLWYASNANTATLDLDDMNHSIPADVRVVDLTGDGLADRMYAADMGGRVWRFDVHNGKSAAELVAGGVFASLGNAHETNHPVATTRRFYNAPDVALLNSGGSTWINVAIGSGYRGHPLNLQTEDRFYSLRDRMPLRRLTQDEYDDTAVFTTITENDLTDITSFDNGEPVTVANGSAGWYLQLVASGSTGSGEKVLAEASTIANMIQFPTYEPPSADQLVGLDACSAPPYGLNRLYTVSAFTGAPVIEQDNAEGLTEEDRVKQLSQTGIAPEVVWLFPSPENPAECTGNECHPAPRCLVGIEQCGVNLNLGPVRTYWRQNSVR
jgi:type IV pilus assembly protein PilY1